MSITNIFALNRSNQGQKLLSVLIDPDKVDNNDLERYIAHGNKYDVDLWFIGGSQMELNQLQSCTQYLKKHSNIPVIIFPGSFQQVDQSADAILFLSLLSGDNPEFLIGHQKRAALKIKEVNIGVIPTAYILVDGGNHSSVAKFSNTKPLSPEHEEEIVSVALAGKYFGMNTVYLEAGSGAQQSINPSLVRKVKSTNDLTLIVGGGIKSADTAAEIWNAGADVIVIGNILEKSPELIHSFIEARNSCR